MRQWAFFYPGKNHGRLNKRPFAPEIVDRRVMVNPHYPNLLNNGEGLPLAPGTLAVCDSGAFQERDMLRRLSADAAMDRQIGFERRLREETGDDFFFEAIVSYDMLTGVDEAIVNGRRVKRRGDEASAAEAVEATIASGLAGQRGATPTGGRVPARSLHWLKTA